MNTPQVVEYRTLKIPLPEGKAALIFPERLSKETADMIIEIVTAQLHRMVICGSDAQPGSTGEEMR